MGVLSPRQEVGHHTEREEGKDVQLRVHNKRLYLLIYGKRVLIYIGT
jgi:hypothetical protein